MAHVADEEGVTDARPRALWRNGDFVLLWSGQAVSTLGSTISTLALPLLVLALTHSAAQAGFIAAAQAIPYLVLALPAGALIDHWDRKAVMIRCDIARFLALGSVPLAAAVGQVTIAQLYLVALIAGTALVFFNIAQTAALTHVVPAAQLPRANALDQTVSSTAALVGPGLAGAIVALGRTIAAGASLAFLVDSLSYLASVLSLLGEERPYLFRTKRGVLSYRTFMSALEKLSAHLPHEGQPYTIASHQFRHSLATDMIEQGVDIYTVKEFLGHATLAMTERYVLLYLKTLKARYDAYRAKTQRTDATALLVGQVEMARPDGDADGGWVPDRVGSLYISPLPNGIGQCRHLAQLDPCPTVPHCPTCPKLAASRRHLPFWHSRLKHLQMTVDALGDDPLWQRARDKHRQELEQSEKVVAIIEREGVYDGRVHLAETLERRSVPQDRASEVGPKAPGRV